MKINKLINRYNKQLQDIVIESLTTPVVLMILIMSVTVLGLVAIPGVDENGKEVHLLFSEAFYFMLYTATTIGYGEIADFTYTQQLWVVVSILLSVVGWFYFLSSIVKLMTNPTFKKILELRNKTSRVYNLEKEYIVFLNYKRSYELIMEKLVDSGLGVVIVVEEEALYNRLKLKYIDANIIMLNLKIIDLDTAYAFGLEKNNLRNVIVSMEDLKDIFDMTMLMRSVNPRVRVTTFSKTRAEEEMLENYGLDYIISSREYIAEDIFNLFMNPKIAEIGEFLHGELLLEDFSNITYIKKNRVLIVGGGRISEYFISSTKNHEDFEITVIDKRNTIKGFFEDGEVVSNVEFVKANLMEEPIDSVVNIENFDYVLLLLSDDFLNVYLNKQLNRYKHIETIIKINQQKNIKMVERERPKKIIAIDRLETVELENILLKPDVVGYRKRLLGNDREYIDKYFNFMKDHFQRKEVREVVIDESSAYALYHKLREVKSVELGILVYDLENMESEAGNGVVPLCIVKKTGSFELIPFFEKDYLSNDRYTIESGDKLIYIPTESFSEYFLGFILENSNELEFVLSYHSAKK